jgi:hypothetical protein
MYIFLKDMKGEGNSRRGKKRVMGVKMIKVYYLHM